MRPTRLIIVLVALCGACREHSQPATPTETALDERGHTAASRFTQEANAAVGAGLPLADPQDREDAQRGLIASEADLVITGADGQVIWNPRSYGFITGDAPASVNPSLWRQSPADVAPYIRALLGPEMIAPLSCGGDQPS